VRPGANTLTIRVEEYGRARVQGVRLLPDTAIGVTPVAIPRVHLVLKVHDQAVSPGTTFSIGFTLSATGAPVKQMAIYPTFDPDVLDIVGPSAIRYRTIHGSITGAFKFKARHVKTTRIVISVQSSADNQPSAAIRVRIDPGSHGAGATLGEAAIGIIGFALLLSSRKVRQAARMLVHRSPSDR
jgi:hypothetical protein